MRTRLHGLLAATVAAWLVTTGAWAGPADPTSGDMVLFPGPLAPLTASEETTEKGPVGWNIPGRHYKSGPGWWVLACRRQCTLTAAELKVSAATHPDYDAPPLPSQFLQWSPLPDGLALAAAPTGGDKPADGVLLAIFKPVRQLADLKLREGVVKTWLHAGMQRYPRPASEGTMETLIRLDDGQSAILLPRLRQPAPPQPGDTAEQAGDEVFLELRAGGLRQPFEAFAFDMGDLHPLRGQDYLLWAGDLDGDGKLDLLLRFAERGWNTVLYLSSRAAPGQLVGEAGRFQFFDPSDPGC